MSNLYDPEKVLVQATNLSNIPGVTHVEVRLAGMSSKYIAQRVRSYLASQNGTSGVGLEWDGHNQSAILRTFVAKLLPVDAVTYLTGLLGPQAHRFA